MSTSNDWTVKYGPSSANTLDDVVEIYIRAGRTNITDQWNPANVRIVARYPNGGTVPDLNDPIFIRRPATTTTVYGAFIRNISKLYGMPYNSTTGTAVADFLVIEAEGWLSEWTRSSDAFPFTTTKTNIKEAIEEVATHYNINYVEVDNAFADVACTTTTIPVGTPFSWLQDIIATGQIRVVETETDTRFAPPDTFTAALQIPSDQTLSSTRIGYDDITAQSLSDNYYNGVNVSADGVGDAQAGATGGNNVQIFTVSTRAATIEQAQQIADYLYAQLNQTTIAISSISGKSNGQISTTPWITLGGFSDLSEILQSRVSVEFRGDTLDAVVEGFELTADPSGWRMTLHLSGGEYYQSLVLDSSTLGILDTNTLGLN